MDEHKLGQSLKQTRLSSGRNLAGVAKELKLSQQALERFEAGDFTWNRLDPLTRGHLKSYVQLLGLSWSEFSDDAVLTNSKLRVPRYEQLKSWVLSQKIRNSVFGVILIIGLVGIGWTVSQLFLAPELTITKPMQSELRQESRQLIVEGQTSAGSDVLINDVPIAVGLHGEFKERVFLAPGVNRVKVVAVNSLSRQAEREFVVVVSTSGANQ